MKRTILLLIFTFSLFHIGNAQEIGIVGPAADGWPPDSDGNPTDIMLNNNGDGTYSIDALTLTTGLAKFREDQAWTVNYGDVTDEDNFPSGALEVDGDDINVVAGVYDIVVDLNNNTYTFTDVGSFTVIELSGSATMGSNPELATTDGENYELSVTEFQDGDLVFQEVGTSNTFGASSFPSGTATAGGANIPVTAGFYEVTFNLNTGDYSFNIPDVGLVGPGITDWPDPNNPTDVLMNSTDGNIYTLNGQVLVDGEVKFRQNQDWTVNWGSTDFPSGSLVPNGQDNIPATAGTYDITFNRSAQTFSFVTLGTDAFTDNNFNYYPNPVEQRLNISSNGIIEDVKIFNMVGQKIIDVDPNTENPQINMSDLASGAYMMKVSIEGVSQSFRLIKK